MVKPESPSPVPTTRRILHVIGGYLPREVGGTQLHLRDLCRHQKAQGHSVHIFTRDGDPEDDEYRLAADTWDGVQITRINHNFRDADRFEKIFSNAEIDERFRDVLRRQAPDIVHIHHLSSLSLGMIEIANDLAVHGHDVKVVMTLQDYWLQCPRGQRIFPDDLEICTTLDRHKCTGCLQRLVPHLLTDREPGTAAETRDESPLATVRQWESATQRRLAMCDALIAPSGFHRDRFVEWGLEPRRFAVIPHGSNLEKLRATPRGRQPIRRLGYLGTVIPTKGLHVLVDAFNRLGRPDLTLDIHGEAPPFFDRDDYLDELQHLVAPGLTVRFHGRYETSDLPRILATMDLLVVPSLWWESFCLTAREGAAAGIPVIVSNVGGGLADAVTEGLALGFETGNAGELAAQIERLCTDEDLRDTMSRRADRVFEMDRCAEAIQAVYEAAIENRNIDTCSIAGRIEDRPGGATV